MLNNHAELTKPAQIDPILQAWREGADFIIECLEIHIPPNVLAGLRECQARRFAPEEGANA